jgi:DNA sulfur modification protein DndD
MIRILEFEKLIISNLFSYYAPNNTPVEVDLSGCDPDNQKNIVIIAGRNGLGKTSLLNCIRLLFFGPTLPVRAASLRIKRSTTDRGLGSSSIISPRAFLLGVPGTWDGLFNSIAKAEGSKDYFVELKWREQSGVITARRSWILDGEDVDEHLSISGPTPEDKISNKDEGQNFLRQRLPEHFSQFYLFDGEDLQTLAEQLFQEGADQNAIKEILGITRIETLKAVLQEIGRSLPRRARIAATEDELEKLRVKKQGAKRELALLKEEEREKKSELQETHSRLAEVGRQLAKLRAHGFGQQGARELQHEIDTLKKALTRWADSVGKELIPITPLLCRPDLVEAAARQLQSLLDKPDLSLKRILDELYEQIPKVLQEPPHSLPPLTRGQSDFYQQRIRNKLVEYTQATKSDELDTPFRHLTRDRLRALTEKLAPYASSNEMHREWKRRITDVADKKAQLSHLESRQRDTGDMSENERGRFEDLVREEESLQRKRDDLLQRFSKLPSDRKVHEQNISQWEGQISKLEEQLRERREAHDRGYLARDLALGFFKMYQEMLQREVILGLSRASTEHWHELMESHSLVSKFELDQQLVVHLWSSDDREIGARSISEGMKQLAATAFLWGLSQITGSRIPIIADTPLGRVDLGHQKRLLERYFPHASRQVIILPTDSEITSEKHALLAPHIYREYKIVNPNGRRARIEEGSLWR